MLFDVKQAMYDRFPGAKLTFANGDSIRLVGLWWERPLDRTDDIHDANWFLAGFDVRAHGERRRLEHSLLSWELSELRECATDALAGKIGAWESLEDTIYVEFSPSAVGAAVRCRVLGAYDNTEEADPPLRVSTAALTEFISQLRELEARFSVRQPPEERRLAGEEVLRRRAANPNFPSIRLGRPPDVP